MKAATLAFLTIALLFTACKKDPPSARSTQYTIIAQNNSGVSGTVTFIEKADSGQTTVDIEVKNTPNYDYVAHIHQGPPSAYQVAIYIFDPIYATGGHISYKQNIALLYDSALTFNGTFVLHDSTANNVLGLCGIGINKQ